jgi:hypothetical protein
MNYSGLQRCNRRYFFRRFAREAAALRRAFTSNNLMLIFLPRREAPQGWGPSLWPAIPTIRRTE